MLLQVFAIITHTVLQVARDENISVPWSFKRYWDERLKKGQSVRQHNHLGPTTFTFEFVISFIKAPVIGPMGVARLKSLHRATGTNQKLSTNSLKLVTRIVTSYFLIIVITHKQTTFSTEVQVSWKHLWIIYTMIYFLFWENIFKQITFLLNGKASFFIHFEL